MRHGGLTHFEPYLTYRTNQDTPIYEYLYLKNNNVQAIVYLATKLNVFSYLKSVNNITCALAKLL